MPKRTPSPSSSTRQVRQQAVDAIAVDSQQRLLEAQATIDRDYASLKELETRYQYLLQSSPDGILLIDAAGGRVFDANEAACAHIGQPREQLIGATATNLFDGDDAQRLAGRLQAVSAGAAFEPMHATLAGQGRTTITAALFRQNGAPVFLVRMDGGQRARQVAREAPVASRLGDYALAATDAIVLTDRAGLILQANAAFVELVQVATERQVRGVSLGRWLGRTSVDLGVLITNLRQRGSLKLFATHLRAEYGALSDVEISAASVGDGASACLGFTIRDIGRRPASAGGKRNDLARSVDQMTELVGRVPMKDIVGNTSGLIEQMCIKAALELTRDNRAAAADLLGISRQSLYVKLRRYGLIGPDVGDDA